MATHILSVPGCTLNVSSPKTLDVDYTWDNGTGTPQAQPDFYIFRETVTVPVLPAVSSGNAWQATSIHIAGSVKWEIAFGNNYNVVGVVPIRPIINGDVGFLALPASVLTTCGTFIDLGPALTLAVGEIAAQTDPDSWKNIIGHGSSASVTAEDFLEELPYLPPTGFDTSVSFDLTLPVTTTGTGNTLCGKYDYPSFSASYTMRGYTVCPSIAYRPGKTYSGGDNWEVVISTFDITFTEITLTDAKWGALCACQGTNPDTGNSGTGNRWLFQGDNGRCHVCDDSINFASSYFAYPKSFDVTANGLIVPNNSAHDVDARLVIDQRERLWIAYTQEHPTDATQVDVRAVWSEDDGNTWGHAPHTDPPILLPGCARSTLALSEDKDFLLCGGRNGSGKLNSVRLAAGDDVTDITPVVCKLDSGSDFAIDNDTFHFAHSLAGLWYGAFVVGGDAALYHSPDDGATWQALGLTIPSGKHPTVAVGQDGQNILFAAQVDNGSGVFHIKAYQLYATADSADDTTLYTFQDDASADLVTSGAAFHLMQGYDGQNRWILTDAGRLYDSSDLVTWATVDT